MSDERYNGWANYPTWAVNLWLSNDEGLYNLVRERVADETDRDAYNLARWLQELCEPGGDFGLVPELEGFPADLLGWALSSVDWNEIAEVWIIDESEES